MAFAERLTIDDLKRLKNFVVASGKAKGESIGEAYMTSALILPYYLGESWVNKHIVSSKPPTTFFCNDKKPPERNNMHMWRTVDLAEMLFNLQDIENFDDCVKRMAAGDVESVFAEMEVGKLLFILDIPFRFIRPQQKLGLDYDIELRFPDDRLAFADTKCKLESTEPSKETVLNSLSKARKQLPAGQIGIVFMKIPEQWMRDVAAMVMVDRASRDFLKSTSRVVSVKVYSMFIEFIGNKMYKQFEGRHFENERPELRPYSEMDFFGTRRFGVGPRWVELPML